ncbi:MAG TPA: histidine phosphatase family protein, partial [Gemmatimonadaceae bacterium]|nr:histidine phosphatase family protein [Gemmatimonadaceae bacterium]
EHLAADGRRQAARLAERLAGLPIAALYSSPVERARETAAPLAARLGLPVCDAPGAVEIDFGEWTGRTFEELARDPRWGPFNGFRSATRIPGGELIVETQARVVVELERLRERHPDAVVAVVSHADVIRAALCHYAGIPLDLMLRLEIACASVSVLEVTPYGARILRLNDDGEVMPRA